MVRGQWTPRPMEAKGKEREVERAGKGKGEEEGHRAVRRRWAHRLQRERVRGKGSEWRSASRRRQLQTRTIHHGDMPTPPPPAAFPALLCPHSSQLYQVVRTPLADHLDAITDNSLDFIWITAPQHGHDEMKLLPRLWAKLRQGGYFGGFWYSNCDDTASRYCAAAGSRVVPDVRQRILDFAYSVGRNVQPTTNHRIKSWYFVK